MGKLSRDDIPGKTKAPCLAASMMLAGLEADDLELIAEQLAAGMSMAKCYEWIRHTFPAAVSSSTLQNHLKARCGCPEGVPLRGVC